MLMKGRLPRRKMPKSCCLGKTSIRARHHFVSCASITTWISLPSFAIIIFGGTLKSDFVILRNCRFRPYQLLSFYAIQRFWSLQYLDYNFLEVQRKERSTCDNPFTLGDVVRRIRNEHFGQIIVYVYQQVLDQRPLKEVSNDLKLPRNRYMLPVCPIWFARLK
jgi:hypothetical protein